MTAPRNCIERWTSRVERSALGLLLAAVFAVIGCQSRTPKGTTTVVWLSVDGLRGDYVDRAHPPNLSRLAREGASTRELVPIYPSKTFPNHIAQVTGVRADRHGIPANVFWDRERRQRYSMSDDSSLLRAEPIWVAAKRQGLRVFVNDWPVSQQTPPPYRPDFAPESFDRLRSDTDRLNDTIERLNADAGNPPPRLVMSYVSAVDGAGHRFGPDSPSVDAALLQVDELIGGYHARIVQWFDRTHGPADELYFLITTDHGMCPVHTLVNLDRHLTPQLLQDVRSVDSGTIGMLYLDDLPADQRESRARAICDRLRGVPYLKAWLQQDVPQQLHLADPARVGDVVISLAPGYCFTERRAATTMPVTTGPLGMHGYDPSACTDMLGAAILWRYRKPLGGRDMGRVENPQWHASVAKLLNIQTAEGVEPPIPLVRQRR